MSRQLRAVIVGAGWAGEGHTKALQYTGVEVIAVCARKPEIVKQVADRLGLEQASTNWQQTLEAVRPDIVALATPAVLREEVIEVATNLDCHIYCDKPLATTAEEASRIYQLVKAADVKHAYAATHRYDPGYARLNELIQEGVIGTLHEIVVTTRGRRSPSLVMPWSWMLTLDAGGGALNNGLPHLLGILQTVTAGEAVRAMGEARVLTTEAPVVPDLHDYRDWLKQGGKLTRENAALLEWRPIDADNAFSALMQFRTGETEIQTTIVFGSGQQVSGQNTGIYLYGDKGTLSVDGMFYAHKISLQLAGDDKAEVLEIPQRLKDDVPEIGDFVQNRWCALARDFVADIEGKSHRSYLTFRDGWRYQVAIEAIRAGQGWQELPN